MTLTDILIYAFNLLLTLIGSAALYFIVCAITPPIIIHSKRWKKNATNFKLIIVMRPPEVLEHYEHIKVQEVYELVWKKNIKNLYRYLTDKHAIRKLEAASRMAELESFRQTGASEEAIEQYKVDKAKNLQGPSYPEFKDWQLKYILKLMDEQSTVGKEWYYKKYHRWKIRHLG